MLPYKTKVKIFNTSSSILDGRIGEIVGIANIHAPLNIEHEPNYCYIIKLDDIMNGYDSIVLTDACIQVIEQ